jgi:hypothetical protein
VEELACEEYKTCLTLIIQMLEMYYIVNVLTKFYSLG